MNNKVFTVKEITKVLDNLGKPYFINHGQIFIEERDRFNITSTEMVVRLNQFGNTKQGHIYKVLSNNPITLVGHPEKFSQAAFIPLHYFKDQRKCNKPEWF